MSCGHCFRSKLSAVAFGIAWGLVAGLCMMLFAWYGYSTGKDLELIKQWAEVYQGYAATISGGLIGFVWGFVEGFIFGLIFAWIYNLCLTCCRSLCVRSMEEEDVVVKRNRKM